MNYSKKSLKFLFNSWIVICLVFIYFTISNSILQNNIVPDGVDNVSGLSNLLLFEGMLVLLTGLIILLLYVFFWYLKRAGRELATSRRYYFVFCLIGLIGIYFSILRPLNNIESIDLLKWNIQKLSKNQVINQIKSLSDYQDDSIVIYKNGTIISSNKLIQDFISKTYANVVKVKEIKYNALIYNKSEAYFAYETAILSYFQAYPKTK